MNYVYDPQQPSTSTASQQHPLHTPETSPSCMNNGQSTYIGSPLHTSTPTAPIDWVHPLQQHQQQSHLGNGGAPTMRRQLVAKRLAQTAEWVEGAAGAAGAARSASALGRSASRASIISDCSVLSGISGVSGVSRMSNLSNMSGLSVRTDYEPEQIHRMVLERCMTEHAAQAPQKEDETPLDRQMRDLMLSHPEDRVFSWLAGEEIKHDPNYREYRKKVLRAYSKKDKLNPAGPTRLKQLADRCNVQFRVVLIDIMWDIVNGQDKHKTAALLSLLDCALCAPEALALLLLNPPPRTIPAERVSIEVLLDCVVPKGGDDAIAAARILLLLQQPPMPQRLKERIQLKGRTVEGTKNILATVLHHTNATPVKRIILLDVLKKYGSKSVVLQSGGIPELLRFLDQEAEDAGSAPPPHNTLLLVEKDAVLVSRIMIFLRGLVVSRDGKISRTRPKCIDEMVKHGALQILSFWMLQYGMPATLHSIANMFAKLSESATIASIDLTLSITRVIQAVGCDDNNLAFFLIVFLRNVSSRSTAHKKTAIDLNVCSELLDLINKWAVASIQQTDAPRFCLNTISIAIETLSAMTQPDQYGVHNAALDSLLKSKDSVIQILLRVASFDFVYDDIRQIPNPNQRSIAYDEAMARLPPDQQVVELNTKNYALMVLHRMFERVQDNIPSLNLPFVQEPLLGESLSVMIWRRMWDLHQQILRVVHRSPTGVSPMELKPINDNLETLHALATMIYRDPACLQQALALIGVPTNALDGTLASFNPFQLLDSPHPYMAAAMLSIVNVVMIYFKAHGVRTHKHPMTVWLQPGTRPDGGDYKQTFCKVAFQDLQQMRMLDADVTQRLSSYFNESLGTYSPALTPGFAPQPMMTPHGGYR